MTDRNLAIRLSVIDGGKVKADLQDIGDSGQKSLQKIEQASDPASKGLLALDAAASNVKGSVQGLVGGLGPLGSALSVIGPVGLAAGAALALVTAGISKSIEVASEAEQSYNRLQAVLKATGDSSGLTADEIVGLSKSLEATTLTTSEKVQDAAAIMATFRSVSGDTFTRAITLAQDMSAVFGMDLSASAKQLGKALEDPVNGLTSLRRVGVVFTQGQKDVIKSFVDTGDIAGAQKVILDALTAKIGGAAVGETQGLVGSSHALAIAWKNMLESIGETSVVSGTAEFSLHALAAVLNSVTGLFEKAPLGERIAEANQQLAAAQETLTKLQNYNPIVMTDMTPLIDSQKAKIEDLRKELVALNAESQKQDQAKTQARAGADVVQRDHRAELLSQQKQSLDDALDKLVTDPVSKIDRINQELAVTKQRIEALREKDGSNNTNVDATLNEAQQVAQAQIDAIQKPINDAAQKATEANQKVIDNLQEQLFGLSDKRQQFIDQAVSRLSDQATSAQEEQTKKLAAQLFDQQAFAEAQKVIDDLSHGLDKLKDKRQAAIADAVARLPETATQAQIDKTKQLAAALYDQNEAEQNLAKMQQEGQQLTDANKTAAENYAEQVAHLNDLLNAGAISQDVYNKAMASADKDLLAGRTDAQAGAIRAFQAYKDSANDAASSVQKAFTDAMNATDDAIVGLVTSGGSSLKKLDSLAQSIVADITKMIVQKSITGPLFDAIGGSISGDGGSSFLGGLFGSIFHEGGVVGETSVPRRQLPSHVFAGAPRYHSGGIAGLMPGEIPAILQRGEVVLPKDANRSAMPVNVVMNITTPDAGSFRSSQAQIAAEAARGIRRAGRNL